RIEGDPALPRLVRHFATKAHVQYLESRLAALAQEAKRCVLDNGNAPQSYLAAQRDSLLQRGILVPDTDTFVLAQDYTFDSPSATTGVMLGRSVNGRVEWKDAEGKTLKQLQAGAIEEEPG